MGTLDKILSYAILVMVVIFVIVAGICCYKNEITMMVVCLGTAYVLAIQCRIDEIIFIEDEEE